MNKYQEALGILDANQTEFKDNRDITKRAEARLKLQELINNYNEALEVIDYVHNQCLYPLVTLLEKGTHYAGAGAIRIAKFKRKVEWNDDD